MYLIKRNTKKYILICGTIFSLFFCFYIISSRSKSKDFSNSLVKEGINIKNINDEIVNDIENDTSYKYAYIDEENLPNEEYYNEENSNLNIENNKEDKNNNSSEENNLEDKNNNSSGENNQEDKSNNSSEENNKEDKNNNSSEENNKEDKNNNSSEENNKKNGTPNKSYKNNKANKNNGTPNKSYKNNKPSEENNKKNETPNKSYKNNKTSEENNKKNGTPNKSYINNDKADTGITELKQQKLDRQKDIEYIENYKGGELEPEWEWARNISVVYTWVDGQDINFSNIKSKYNGGYRTFNSRDRSVDELRYSLRSLKQYMPWHNGTIYILTDNQIPKWLDTTNPRIQIVFHKDIFPEHYRPTYDSNAIELFLDKIPGITEYFLYFNDDIFLNNYVHPCFFFTSRDHYPKAYRSYVVTLTKEKTDKIIKMNSVLQMFQASKYFTRETLREYFDPDFEYRYCLHTAYVIYRDMMEPFRQLFKDEIRTVFSDKFRSPYETHMLYMYQTYLYYGSQNKDFPEKVGGVGKVSNYVGSPLPYDPNRTVKKYSCEMVPPSTSVKYIKFGSITNRYDYNEKEFELFKNNTNIRIYNLNDEYSKDESLYQFVEYMITRYPNPTEFEKKKYVDLELKVQPILEDINELYRNETSNVFKEEKFEKIFTSLKSYVRNYTSSIIQMYLDKKDSLSKPQTDISQIEEEEVEFLLNHPETEILEEEWQWASDISIVYKLGTNNNANSISKFEQLKYSLRSIEKYLPWFKGKIFIITMDNTKSIPWLNKNNKRIQIIPQSQLIPDENNFNRFTIEMYLDKIPGISERFIFIKNNHFFIKYTHPHFFFSNSFYPKYHYYNPLGEKDVKRLNKINKPLYETYNLIKDYFGNSYFKAYRLHFDSPYPLYRDLFNPIREMLGDDINQFSSTEIKYLPMYLITNYIIYGTNQPYYPDFVAGYGKIRNVTAPILNENRTIDFYGYDIPSPYTLKRTLLPNIQLNEKYSNNKASINKIKNSNELFFNLRIKNNEKISSKIKNQILDFFDDLYQEESNFEK